MIRPTFHPAPPLDCAPGGDGGTAVRATTPWGRAHDRVRRAGPAGLPESALPLEYAAELPAMLAAGILTRDIHDGTPVLLATRWASEGP